MALLGQQTEPLEVAETVVDDAVDLAVASQRYWQSLTLCEPYLIDRMVGSIDGETIRGIVAVRRRAVGIATVRRDR
jgi:hypothetical protein